MSNHKSYITIKTSQIDTVNFAEVIENRESLRYSLDDSEFICKWRYGAPYMPESVALVPEADRSDLMDHATALALMATSAWTDPNPPA